MRQIGKRPTVKQVADQKAAILAFLADGERHSYSEIMEATGLKRSIIDARLTALRANLEYLGRVGVSSHWRLLGHEGCVPVRMEGYPESYLRWGGWTV